MKSNEKTQIAPVIADAVAATNYLAEILEQYAASGDEELETETIQRAGGVLGSVLIVQRFAEARHRRRLIGDLKVEPELRSDARPRLQPLPGACSASKRDVDRRDWSEPAAEIIPPAPKGSVEAEVVKEKFAAAPKLEPDDDGELVGEMLEEIVGDLEPDEDKVRRDIKAEEIRRRLTPKRPDRDILPKREGWIEAGKVGGVVLAELGSGAGITFDEIDRLAVRSHRSKRGWLPSLENTIMCLEGLGVRGSYNVFADEMVIWDRATGKRIAGRLDHIASLLRQVMIKRFEGYDPGTHMLEAMRSLCLRNQFDPVKDYLLGLTWDEVPRLNRWLSVYCGVADTLLNSAIGTKVLCAAVRRILTPGCKFDFMMVLEGKQGIGKSTVIRVLAGDNWFSDAPILAADGKQQQELAKGVWIYEVAELEGMRRADIAKIKLFLSAQSDRARPAYGREVIDQPRRCVFIGTTNEQTYLKDPSGNRRFWPVKCGEIDIEMLRRDRDQLWAEAVTTAEDEPLFLDRSIESLAEVERGGRVAVDPWQEKLEPLLDEARTSLLAGKKANSVGMNITSKSFQVSSTALLNVVLNGHEADRNDQLRLGAVMQMLGWEHNGSPMWFVIAGKKRQTRGYTMPLSEADLTERNDP